MTVVHLHLETRRGRVPLPAFFPDATRGAVRAMSPRDVAGVGIPGLVMNTFHLMLRPGVARLVGLGGLHAFSGWNGPILTDSGGFQVMSLIRDNPSNGTIRPREVIFRPSPERRKLILTPEKSVRAQYQWGADILVVLDHCTYPDDPPELSRRAVDDTLRWARASREEFNRLVTGAPGPPAERPLLFAVIQGGSDLARRAECAAGLVEMGFDGYGYGGWPLSRGGELLGDLLAATAELMPPDRPKYAMGVGKPENIVACVSMGYTLFDSVIPTRDARHGRLYTWKAASWSGLDLKARDFYDNLYIHDQRHARDRRPVSEICDCHLCRDFSRGFLHHLFKVDDPLAFRLATTHNLRFYTQLMGLLRGETPGETPS